ncbi:MAG TPA: hypothetical protein VHM26_08165 [Chitinophagaceae bacterium]|jgi:hypothetical protein|nr:hypothetical protein [Chitinophagaceae bacterium]
MDEFKKYIEQHRAQLDTEEPGEMPWNNIKQVLHPGKTRIIPLYIRWVAAACIILIAGVAIYLLVQHKANNKTDIPVAEDHKHNHQQQPKQEEVVNAHVTVIPEKKEEKVAVVKNNPVNKRKGLPQPSIAKKKSAAPVYGFEEVEASYAGMLGIQLERLRRQPIYAEDGEYFHSFKKQFADLGNEEEQVKRRIKDNGMRDEYFDDLITIYQEKINVLKQLQFEINRMNNRVKQADPSINQQPPSYINL